MKFPIYGKLKNGNQTTNQLTIQLAIQFLGCPILTRGPCWLVVRCPRGPDLLLSPEALVRRFTHGPRLHQGSGFDLSNRGRLFPLKGLSHLANAEKAWSSVPWWGGMRGLSNYPTYKWVILRITNQLRFVVWSLLPHSPCRYEAPASVGRPNDPGGPRNAPATPWWNAAQRNDTDMFPAFLHLS